MSIPDTNSGPTGAPVVARRAFFAAILSTIGIVVLIWSEIWVTLAAGIWAFAELLGAGMPAYILLSAVLVPLGAWASWHVVRLAWIGETHGSD